MRDYRGDLKAEPKSQIFAIHNKWFVHINYQTTFGDYGHPQCFRSIQLANRRHTIDKTTTFFSKKKSKKIARNVQRIALCTRVGAHLSVRGCARGVFHLPVSFRARRRFARVWPVCEEAAKTSFVYIKKKKTRARTRTHRRSNYIYTQTRARAEIISIYKYIRTSYYYYNYVYMRACVLFYFHFSKRARGVGRRHYPRGRWHRRRRRLGARPPPPLARDSERSPNYRSWG